LEDRDERGIDVRGGYDERAEKVALAAFIDAHVRLKCFW
jgi:hypothetical protein